MDAWLKWLVAATCCVIIAGAGYMFWKDRQEVARQESAAQQAMCNLMLDEFRSGSPKQDWRVGHIVRCVVDGNLSEADFSTPELQPYLAKAKDSIEYARSQK